MTTQPHPHLLVETDGPVRTITLNHATRRKRKLLMHKEQIIKISHRTKEGGYTLVPLSIYFKDGRAKVELAVAKGKREFDKRQALRERQDKREADRAISSRRHLGE